MPVRRPTIPISAEKPPARPTRRRAAPEIRPDPRPFFARPENNRAWDEAIFLADFIGLHLICPVLRCGRHGGCAAEDRRAWPFCHKQYRPIVQYALQLAAAARGEAFDRPPESPDGTEPSPLRRPPTSLLALMAAAGAPIEQFARPAEAGPDSWEWHRDGDATALLGAFRRNALQRGKAEADAVGAAAPAGDEDAGDGAL
jgi:hypothetical protein